MEDGWAQGRPLALPLTRFHDTSPRHHVAMETTTCQTSPLLQSLRGDRSRRPTVDPMLSGGLRAWLEDELSEMLAGTGAPRIEMTPLRASRPELATIPAPATFGVGALIHALVTQRVSFGSVEHPMDDAVSSIEAEPSATSFVEWIHGLGLEDFSRLSTEVAEHDAVLAEALGRIPASWLPRTRVPIRSQLCGGMVNLSCNVDLVLGPPASTVATVCLLDVSSAPILPTTNAQLGVMALAETLRSGSPPLRVAGLSTKTGESLVLDVDDEMLVASIRCVVEAVRTSVSPIDEEHGR